MSLLYFLRVLVELLSLFYIYDIFYPTNVQKKSSEAQHKLKLNHKMSDKKCTHGLCDGTGSSRGENYVVVHCTTLADLIVTNRLSHLLWLLVRLGSRDFPPWHFPDWTDSRAGDRRSHGSLCMETICNGWDLSMLRTVVSSIKTSPKGSDNKRSRIWEFSTLESLDINN